MRQLFFFVHLSERLGLATVDEHNDEPVVAFAQLAQVQREDERGWFCDPPGGVRRVGGSPSRRPAASLPRSLPWQTCSPPASQRHSPPPSGGRAEGAARYRD